MMRECGVYLIKNVITGECYVGSSQNMASRKSNHLNGFGNRRIKEDLSLYGREGFQFIVVLRCAGKFLRREESKWIRAIRPAYNLESLTVDGCKLTQGHPHSEESKAKIARARLGVCRPHSSAAKLLISGSTKNRWQNPEYRARQMAARARNKANGRTRAAAEAVWARRKGE